MVVTEISNPFYPNLIAPLHDELAELGYRMALFTERLEGEQQPARPPRGLFDRGIDGAVLTTSTLDGAVPRELLRRGLPFTFLTRDVDGIPADAVTVDNALGASLMAARGRAVRSSAHRRDLRAGRHQHGPRPRARLPRRAAPPRASTLDDEAVDRGPYTVDAGREAMEAILDARRPPDRGRLLQRPRRHRRAQRRACRRPARAGGRLDHRLGRPADGVVGDLQLTTVRQSMHEMARAAARLIVERVEGVAGPEPRHVLFDPELVLRSTLGPPRA